MVYQSDYLKTSQSTRLQIESTYFKREFQLYYQPIFSLKSQRLYSLEVLLYWQSDRAQIYSQSSLALVEDSHLDVSLHQWALCEACKQMKLWQAYYLADIPLRANINLSAKQLHQPQIFDFVEQLVETLELIPAYVKLEMPAEWILQNYLIAKKLIRQFKKIGISICVDNLEIADFCDEVWQRLPAKTFKLSKNSTKILCRDLGVQNLFLKRFSVAQKKYIRVAAQNIENVTELDLMKKIGCTYGQGDFLSQLLNSRQAAELIRSQVRQQPKDLMAYLVVMNILSKVAQRVLGKAVMIRYWKATRPTKPWLALIQPYQDRQMIFNSMRSTRLDSGQQQDLRKWIHRFIERCHLIFKGFRNLVIQTSLTSAERRLLSLLCPDLILE